MRWLLLIVMTVAAMKANAVICDITGQYRCKNGRMGSVIGRGENLDAAKVAARDQARDICGGMVDYVRFMDNTTNC